MDTPHGFGNDLECGSGSSGLCSWDVPTGSTVTAFEQPDPGYEFVGWTGACTGTARTCAMLLAADKSATATFKAK